MTMLGIIILCFWIGVIWCMLHTAIESPILPLQSIFRSWIGAFRYLFENREVALALLCLFLAAPALQILFVRIIAASPSVLLAAGIAWQAITATLIAFLALRIHDWVLTKGSERYKRRPEREVWAMVYGLTIFLLLLGVNYGFAQLTTLAPPGLWPAGALANSLLRVLLFAPLALVRPALSLGEARPWSAAFAAMKSCPVSFLIWITALSAPIVLSKFVVYSFIRQHDPSTLHYFEAQIALAAFNVVNCIAFEMTTLRMLRNLDPKRAVPDYYSDWSVKTQHFLANENEDNLLREPVPRRPE